MNEPTWASIDFGFGNTDASTYRSFVRPQVGGIDVASVVFAFPGIDGAFSQSLGARTRTIIWDMDTYADSEVYLNALEAAIEAKLQAGTYQMTVHSKTLPQVELLRFESVGYYEPVSGPFACMKRYRLTFRELNP